MFRTLIVLTLLGFSIEKSIQSTLNFDPKSLEQIPLPLVDNNLDDFVYGKDYVFFPAADGTNGVVFGALNPSVVPGSQSKADPDPKDIHLYLYTQSNPVVPEEMFPGDLSKLNTSKFRKNKPLKILGHGFASGYEGEFPLDTKTKYLEVYGDINVISIDWSVLAEAPWYYTAAANVELVGNKTGALVTFLIEHGYVNLNQVHYVGHSLGAHVGAATARYIKSGKMGRLSGLDPAKPSWEGNPLALNASSANFVDVIHTCGGRLGLMGHVGDVDFYPNGGAKQPGCDGWQEWIAGTCSHSRAHQFFLESIKSLSSGGSNNITFGSCRCSSCQLTRVACLESYKSNKCTCFKDPWVQMGEHLNNLAEAKGDFLLETNAEPPYSKLPNILQSSAR